MATAVFVKSNDTMILEHKLREVAVGGRVTYEDLGAVIGLPDVRDGCRGLLNTARKSCEKDGILFGTIPKVGLVRLSESEKVAAADGDIAGAYRKSRRARKRLETVNVKDLDDNDRRSLTVKMAQLCGVELMSSKAAEKKVLQASETSALPERLAMRDVLNLMGGVQ